MLPKMFYRARMARLAKTYGANIDLWPAYEQLRAHKHLKTPGHQKDLSEAADLDEALARLRPRPLSDDSLWQALSLIIGPTVQSNIYDFDGERPPVELSRLKADFSEDGFRPNTEAKPAKVAKRKLFFM